MRADSWFGLVVRYQSRQAPAAATGAIGAKFEIDGACPRQRAIFSSRTADLNGFCRLHAAPSLVAMVRKSGGGVHLAENAWPDITIIGTSGRYSCTCFMVSRPSI